MLSYDHVVFPMSMHGLAHTLPLIPPNSFPTEFYIILFHIAPPCKNRWLCRGWKLRLCGHRLWLSVCSRWRRDWTASERQKLYQNRTHLKTLKNGRNNMGDIVGPSFLVNTLKNGSAKAPKDAYFAHECG